MPINPNDAPRGTVAEELVSLVTPTSVAADQYRTLRYNVEALRKDSGIRLFAVTSPSPGDGKTLTTLNLAGTLAQAEHARVLVIDADLRKPSVARYLGFGERRLPGMTDALRDSSYQLADIVHHLREFNLSVVLAGAPEASPYELLNGPRLPALLEEARRDYDCVLVDTPPAVLLPDCRLIERSVDGFLVIVAANKTPRKLVAEALSQLDPVKVLGIVFNADDRPFSGYYGYYGYGRPVSRWRRLFGAS